MNKLPDLVKQEVPNVAPKREPAKDETKGEVVDLKRNQRPKVPPDVRRALYEAYSETCPLCHLQMTPREMQVDHIIPINLKEDRQKLNAYFKKLGEHGFRIDGNPEDFNFNALQNYMPMHNTCNRSKWHRPLTTGRAVHYLDMARTREPGIVKTIGSFKKMKLSDRELDAWRSEIEENPNEADKIAEEAYNLLTDDLHPFTTERWVTEAFAGLQPGYLNSKSTVRLKAFLPSIGNPEGSCGVMFRSLKARSVVISLSHNQICEQLLGGIGSPPEEGLRGFSVTGGPDETGLYLVALGATRLPLRIDELRELADICDDLAIEYGNALRTIEGALRCRGFSRSRVHKLAYRIVKVKRSLWDRMVAFTESHDFAKGKSEWYIFDYNPNYIKVYTPQTDRFDAGYHLFLYPEQVDDVYWGNLRRADDDVWIVAEPQGIDFKLSLKDIGERNAWDIQTAFEWLTREFMPQVVNKPGKVFSWASHTSTPPDSKYQSAMSEVCPEPEQIRSVEQLVELAGTLQYHYSGQNEVFLTAKELQQLYSAAATVFQRTPIPESQFHYIAQKLPFDSVPKAPGDLHQFMEGKAQRTQARVYPSSHVDGLLTCIWVPLNDYRTHLNQQEASQVARLLAPFYEKMELHQLLQRSR